MLLSAHAIGAVSEYPIYASQFNIIQNTTITVLIGPDGFIYVVDLAITDAMQNATGGIIRIDPALW